MNSYTQKVTYPLISSHYFDVIPEETCQLIELLANRITTQSKFGLDIINLIEDNNKLLEISNSLTSQLENSQHAIYFIDLTEEIKKTLESLNPNCTTNELDDISNKIEKFNTYQKHNYTVMKSANSKKSYNLMIEQNQTLLDELRKKKQLVNQLLLEKKTIQSLQEKIALACSAVAAPKSEPYTSPSEINETLTNLKRESSSINVKILSQIHHKIEATKQSNTKNNLSDNLENLKKKVLELSRQHSHSLLEKIQQGKAASTDLLKLHEMGALSQKQITYLDNLAVEQFTSSSASAASSSSPALLTLATQATRSKNKLTIKPLKPPKRKAFSPYRQSQAPLACYGLKKRPLCKPEPKPADSSRQLPLNRSQTAPTTCFGWFFDSNPPLDNSEDFQDDDARNDETFTSTIVSYSRPAINVEANSQQTVVITHRGDMVSVTETLRRKGFMVNGQLAMTPNSSASSNSSTEKSRFLTPVNPSITTPERLEAVERAKIPSTPVQSTPFYSAQQEQPYPHTGSKKSKKRFTSPYSGRKLNQDLDYAQYLDLINSYKDKQYFRPTKLDDLDQLVNNIERSITSLKRGINQKLLESYKKLLKDICDILQKSIDGYYKISFRDIQKYDTTANSIIHKITTVLATANTKSTQLRDTSSGKQKKCITKPITSDSEASTDSDKENYYNLSQLKTIESEIEKLHKNPPNFEQKKEYLQLTCKKLNSSLQHYHDVSNLDLYTGQIHCGRINELLRKINEILQRSNQKPCKTQPTPTITSEARANRYRTGVTPIK